MIFLNHKKTYTTVTTTLVVLVMLMLNLPLDLSAATFQITNSKVGELDNDEITISWSTNEPAYGWLQIGDQQNEYDQTYTVLTYERTHEIKVKLPREKTNYHYRIIAENQAGIRTTSFDFNFKVGKFTDTIPPKFIQTPKVIYRSDDTAVISWETNEATRNILYIKPYGADRPYQKIRVKQTDKYTYRAVIVKLKPLTQYEYEVVAQDGDGNKTQSAVLTFQTTQFSDESELRLLNLLPLDKNSTLITNTTFTTTFTSSRPARCELLIYGKSVRYKEKISEQGIASYGHNLTIKNLNPGETYEFTISCRDVLGKKLNLNKVEFKTRAPQVLGYQTQEAETFFGQNYELVRSSAGRIYVLVNKQRHHITSPEIFNSYGFDWNAIRNISEKELNRYPVAKLVKTFNSPGVYFIYHGYNRKKSLLTERAFSSYRNNSFKKVITISERDLAQYKDLVLIKTSNDPTVFVIQNNLKRPIANWAAMQKHNLTNQPIGIVSARDLESYYTGPILE